MRNLFLVGGLLLWVITGTFATTNTVSFGVIGSRRLIQEMADYTEDHLGFYEASIFNMDNRHHESYGIFIRGVSSPRDVGFYWGVESSLFLILTYNSLGISVKNPLGFRTKGRNNGMGFYFGLGPAYRTITNFGSAFTDYSLSYHSLGGFAEIGLQTNKTAGTGFHIALQADLYPFHLVNKERFFNIDEALKIITFEIGLSWRREKGSRKDKAKAEATVGSTE